MIFLYSVASLGRSITFSGEGITTQPLIEIALEKATFFLKAKIQRMKGSNHPTLLPEASRCITGSKL